MVMEVVQEDMYEGGMQCMEHPFKNSTQGGICAFCLQEKLGKLVSSSFPVAIFPSSSSSLSSSPSFRSGIGNGTTITTTTTNNTSSSSTNIHAKRAKLPFLLTQKKKKKKEAMMAAADASNIVFKRSKSTATPRKASIFMEDYSPQRKGFWSFLYLSHPTTTKKTERPHKVDISTLGTTSMNGVDLIKLPRERKREELVVVEENESPDQERKVSRSRSVGCGSRSFSGDFLERISTGFGDCTLRRVESQREGKSRIHSMNGNKGQDCIKERVKCRGIFSGFIITSSSSSSSSSSYMVSSKIEENFNGKTTTTTTTTTTAARTTSTTPASHHHHMRNLVHARSKSWGWAFASPMRAFSKPSSSVKRDSSMKKATSTTTPNLAAIPSLLAARG